MKSGGFGVGSASIILIFAVLSMAVFSLITFVVAGNDKVLVEANAEARLSFYSADTQAERIVAYLMATDITPSSVDNVEIHSQFDENELTETISFITPISDIKSLRVEIVRTDASFDIRSWKTIIIDEWIIDDTLNIWGS